MARHPVSVICVFNDPEVRQQCLDASIELLRAEAPAVEYIPVDNTQHQFSSAGAALNHGASLATNDYLVFAHQDVFLHSLTALEEAADLLAGGEFGLVGCFGFTATGGLAGFIRDRVVLLGAPLTGPVDVDSLDEVLFMISREMITAEPLSQDPELAWHAYSVEYGLRMRARGLRVAAANIPVTHNSLTINLAKLDVAHRRVAAMHPGQLPVRTTCGVVSSADPEQAKRVLLPAHRWRYRWLTGSWAAHAARRAAGGGSYVLNDIRLDVDDLIAASPEPFTVFNVDPGGTFVDVQPLELSRLGHRVRFASGTATDLLAWLPGQDAGASILLTNLDDGALRELAPALASRHYLGGLHEDFGAWVLLGPTPATVPDPWRSKQAKPLGMPALV